MKRHRFLNFSIDATRNVHRAEMPTAMKERLKQEERANFEAAHGVQDFEEKFERWLSVPKPTLSVVGEHTALLEDIERAYVVGSLYSSLTGACCLGERIFNHIILRIRDSYRTHAQYKHVYRLGSLNDWDLAIKILRQWDVISKKTEEKYRGLYRLRVEAVHFQNKKQNLGSMAKEGIELINDIVSDLFAISPEKKFVSWCEVPGEIYLRSGYKDVPFVKEFFLPSTVLVGYKHTIGGAPEGFLVKDDNEYEDRDISDAEFVRLRKRHTMDNDF